MEGHLNKDWTLAELEPGWSEETSDRRTKTSMRMHGSLRMALLRVGRTPENSRRYVHGDPVNMIDWKAYARTDQLIIREQRDQASAKILVVMDVGSAMNWPESEVNQGCITKAELAIRMGMWLAHAHLVMGDTVECWLRTSKSLPDQKWVPRSPADVLAVFAAARVNLLQQIHVFFNPTGWIQTTSDNLWVLSDGLDHWDIEEAGRSSRLPLFLHTLSSLECDVQWMDDETCYLEREPIRKDYMGAQLKSGNAYALRITEWRESWRSKLRQQGWRYFFATDKTPVGTFFHFFTKGDDR